MPPNAIKDGPNEKKWGLLYLQGWSKGCSSLTSEMAANIWPKGKETTPHASHGRILEEFAGSGGTPFPQSE